MIRREAAKLDEFHDAIVGCRVFVDVEDRKYSVRVDVQTGVGDLLVTLSTQEDLVTALQRAFDATLRQLREPARHAGVGSEAGRI